mmetsp:Transcript_42027/g.64385  ORF Transcript_42027/g.64385 Transcript_42027/m.64385 type:complete len:146 (+) Transcript_42027:97-534(+)|eukprot:CAMPEP_0170496416 /NCGR_PEP_ID=MMETSP0208-20121228/21465_1 /TAXON_ID=197538 /ORGANISM="Strombidium inclinatum, Strain S3" /LENGTH=145 /DNA_ID=CAMNT_0010772959 /DNA_START=47 /DNA_END=484 /DNA_ORIENTATION=-
MKKLWLVFNMALKFYLPIHLVPTLIFKRQKLLKEPIKAIKSIIKNIVKSALFISVYVSSFWWFYCKLKNYRRRTDRWNIIIASFFCSFAILFEPPSRRTELALYMFPRVLESMFFYMEKRGYVKSIANGEVLVFAVAMGIIMFCY